MCVKLHSSRDGEGLPLVLLHGLFGAGNNLGALARAMRDVRSVYSVDLPNHGRSDTLQNATLERMAETLASWMSQVDVHKAQFVGHSLGGKVAMQLALSRPALVSALVVADIAPVAYPPGHDSVFAALEAVAAIDCHSRAQAADIMAAHLEEEQVIQFLLTSLRRDPDGRYRWRFDLQQLQASYGDMRAAPTATSPYPGPVLFIKGGESNYILERNRAEIIDLFPAATLKVMPGCGHWLHAERPDQFNRIARRFLLEQGVNA